ncbi:MAG: S8 family serine peptidase [Desulfobacterales bacterium]|nr:S8 family serine peptidase [Desulfobacterales bacterium]
MSANDGWLVTSGTSAEAPQVGGICALLKEVKPSLSPALTKAILRASARDFTKGERATGQPAGAGHDGATGAGLVDAFMELIALPAQPLSPHDLSALTSPR